MSYTRQTWANGTAGGTKLNATRLTNVELGLENASTDADYAGSGLGSFLTSGQSVLPRMLATSSVSMTSGSLRLTYFRSIKAETVGNVRMKTSATAAAATPTIIRVGLYSEAVNGDLTLIASTVNDTTLLAAVTTAYTKAFSTPVAITEGSRYAVGLLVVTAATAPTVLSLPTTGDATELGIAPRLSGLLASQANLPSTIAAGTISNNGGVPYFAVTP